MANIFDLDDTTFKALEALNNPKDAKFEPTIFTSLDYDKIRWDQPLIRWLIKSYIRMAQSVVRVETDVVMITHILLYCTTTIPSACILFFWHFSWLHGLVHVIMQLSYMGTYTLMMHQHIHMRGILKKHFAVFDQLFPYITDPLMGHTWNSYYYHHVKHHHVEGNGPLDLSSTLRFQRDSASHFLLYFARFFLLVWLELPLYFLFKKRPTQAAKAALWELGNYATLYLLYKAKPGPTFCVFLMPLLLMRLGLMLGNWGQHALVDENEPDSDYRSSITLIDVAVSTGPFFFLCSLMLTVFQEQPPFVQRRLSYLASPEPLSTLERPSKLVHQGQATVRIPRRSGEYRLSPDRGWGGRYARHPNKC